MMSLFILDRYIQRFVQASDLSVRLNLFFLRMCLLLLVSACERLRRSLSEWRGCSTFCMAKPRQDKEGDGAEKQAGAEGELPSGIVPTLRKSKHIVFSLDVRGYETYTVLEGRR